MYIYQWIIDIRLKRNLVEVPRENSFSFKIAIKLDCLSDDGSGASSEGERSYVASDLHVYCENITSRNFKFSLTLSMGCESRRIRIPLYRRRLELCCA
jgi:hypothetical protein